MSKAKTPKFNDVTIHDTSAFSKKKPVLTVPNDIDRVLDILKNLPMLRRYGGDEEALKEAAEILEAIKEKI